MAFAEFEGSRVHFDVAGGGEVLVLLHGLFRDGASWDRAGYVAALRTEFTVVTVDALGHGESSRPTAAHAYGPAGQASSVVAVLDALRCETAVLWGYSFGAWVAAATATHQPERVAGMVLGGWDLRDGMRTAFLHGRGSLPERAWFAWLRRQAAKQSATNPSAPDGDHLTHCFAAMLADPGEPAAVLAHPERVVMYSGSRDPYATAMAELAAQHGTRFISLPGHNHATGFDNGGTVLEHVGEHLTRLPN